ncbi:MAG: flagellar export chaperone FliS [Alphaproteobacteria bacterium]|nr:MAG: flagellar export chaperone FliS [Alphaproteobacteria bacterium]
MTYGPPSNNGQRDGAQQYMRQKIEQASGVEQVLMLYDGAVKFLMVAKEAIARGDIEARSNANRRAMEIVAYLLDMVNPETGGEAARSLFGIYTSLLKRMMQVDFQNNADICDELVANIRNLRTGMAQALAAQSGVKPATGNVVASPASESGEPARRNAVA